MSITSHNISPLYRAESNRKSIGALNAAPGLCMASGTSILRSHTCTLLVVYSEGVVYLTIRKARHNLCKVIVNNVSSGDERGNQQDR